MQNQEANATRLVDTVRKSTRQFKEKNDMSRNVRHPEKPFKYAYDKKIVNAAIEECDARGATEFVEGGDVGALHNDLAARAQRHANQHPGMPARDFSRTGLAGLLQNPYKASNAPKESHKRSAATKKLRRKSDECTTEYKRNDDISGSLFGPPASDVVLGCDISQMDEALEEWAKEIRPDYSPITHTLTWSQSLILEAQDFSEETTDPEFLEFVSDLTNYLLAHVPDSERLRENPLRRLNSVPDIQPEQDILEPVEDDISELNGVEQIIQHASAVAAHCPDDYARNLAHLILAHFVVNEMEESGELMALLTHNSPTESRH